MPTAADELVSLLDVAMNGIDANFGGVVRYINCSAYCVAYFPIRNTHYTTLLELTMKFKPILLVLMLILLVGCVQFDYDKKALEKSIFGKPLPNRITTPAHKPQHLLAAHDHDIDLASAKTSEYDEETAVQHIQFNVTAASSSVLLGEQAPHLQTPRSDNRAVGICDGCRGTGCVSD